MKVWKILLACWLILWGLLAVSNFQLRYSGEVLGFVAVATGILIFFDR